MPEIGVSSTRIRRRIAQGRPVRYLVPDAVLELIESSGPLPRGGAGVTRRGRGRRARGGVAERRAEEPGASAELARRIAAIVDDKKGEEIVALDVRELVSYTDYLVIATARNERQAKAIADEVRLGLKRDDDLLPARAEGEGEARWVLLDYLDCVLHVQVPEMRDRYRLERLWGEGPRLELALEGAGRASAPRSVRRARLASRTVKEFKRSLFGYRPKDVDEALAARDAALAEGAKALAWHAGELERRRARITQLELVCDPLSDRVVRARPRAGVDPGASWPGRVARSTGSRRSARQARGPGDADQAAGAARGRRSFRRGWRRCRSRRRRTAARLLDAIRGAIDRMGLSRATRRPRPRQRPRARRRR